MRAFVTRDGKHEGGSGVYADAGTNTGTNTDADTALPARPAICREHEETPELR